MDNFRSHFYHILTCTDRSRLEFWCEKLQRLEHVPKYNGHYVSCPWSRGYAYAYDDCVCATVARIDYQYERMRSFYGVHFL